MRRLLVPIVVLALTAVLLTYLHDPPWAGRITSGMRDWEEDPAGVRFRRTSGHATFYVPSDATMMTLPLRAVLPAADGGPVFVDVTVDGRWLARIGLPEPRAWKLTTLPLPRRATGRRFRRVELRVSLTEGQPNKGVMVGEAGLARPGQ